ncbi:hypothetical protein K431DRAFT_238962 [Polychaeton citri CBS 116435]|uniref:Zn(2)-C6 fungal-type domain-containing protein n=1 Tax=Polychaeton citri CBS 116435 TaxID=1314669 RepID=A0A9P4QE94_9PEZI|nr:hypothetical protein K431DRAFT_238962 [Polychaeton citri CBS 116435]
MLPGLHKMDSHTQQQSLSEMADSIPQNRRRNKPVLSCTYCRGRKVRCDRQSPCGACVRRGQPSECTFTVSEQERKDAIDYRPHVRGQQARQRIARLENLVTEMRDMVQGSRQAPLNPTPSGVSPNDPGPQQPPPAGNVTDSMGRLSLTDGHEVYIGSSHWVTILEDIQHLKDELSEELSDGTCSQETTPCTAEYTYGGSSATRFSLLTSTTCLPKEQILAMIPPRKVVDRHVSHFFNAFDFAPVVLLKTVFLAEYVNFWRDLSTAPVMWVGLLSSIISMSIFLQQKEAETLGLLAVESQNTLETYRTLTIHCLVMGDYLRPSRYTIETLALHFALDQNFNLDTNIGNWVLIGVVIRLALRMGLHRDPSHWSNIRPVQAELRRRLWMTLYQMDFFTSTQVGLPRIVKDSQCDTRPPAYLVDDEIRFEHDETLPERSTTDPSPLLHIIQRDAVIKVAAEIYDATEAAQPSSATTAALGVKLQNAVDSIPTWLKYRSLEELVADSPTTILHKIILDILIHKAVYLLHRRSFMKGSSDEESTNASKHCIKSALSILEHQRNMGEETQPGGVVFSIRWRVSSSLSHEFLQATTILCFALSRFNEAHAGTTNPPTLYRRDEIMEALTAVKGLWEKNADRSMEAQRAATAIATVLKQDADRSSAQSFFTASDGFFDQMPGTAAPAHLSNFGYGQGMEMDPSLFAFDDIAAFGNIWDDLVMPEQFGDDPTSSRHV